MKKLWLLLMLVIPYQSTFAQEVEHAPTVEQCRADQQLWVSELERSSYALTPFEVLQARVLKMVSCATIDPAFKGKYHNVEAEIMTAEAIRISTFLTRHDLWNQFLIEDGQAQAKAQHLAKNSKN